MMTARKTSVFRFGRSDGLGPGHAGMVCRFRVQRGQAIIESVACMLILCLILFGLLQIFYLNVAQMFSDYAAFCSARSRSVGFADYLVDRSARVGAIGASGNLLFPEGETYGGPLQQFGVEAVRIPEYIRGERWLFYGIGNPESPEWDWDRLGINIGQGIGMVESTVSLNRYPLHFPMRRAFTYDDDVNVSGNARLADHAGNFLEE
jgi:hypothetical protein